jgi:lipopolysaccharide transport system permease protein
MAALQKSWHLLQVNFRHRDLIFDLILRDFKIKYIGSLLGRYWSFLHPLALIAMYSLVFAKVLKLKMDGPSFAHPWAFTLYLCVGLLPWNAFSEMLLRGVGSFQENANLVKKVSFPKEILLTISIGSTSLPLLFSLSLYLLLLLLSGYGLSLWALCVPLVFILQALFVYGLVLVLSVGNVFFRDIQQLIPIVLQLWFWATPLVYTADKVPAGLKWILYLNPYYYFASLYQQILFYQCAPQQSHLLLAVAAAVTSFGLGSVVYYRFCGLIADEL